MKQVVGWHGKRISLVPNLRLIKLPYAGFSDRPLVDSGNVFSLGANVSFIVCFVFLYFNPKTWAEKCIKG